MTLVCQNANCTYRSASGFCVKDFVFLTPQAACSEWYTKDGMRKAFQKPETSDKVNQSDTKDS